MSYSGIVRFKVRGGKGSAWWRRLHRRRFVSALVLTFDLRPRRGDVKK